MARGGTAASVSRHPSSAPIVFDAACMAPGRINTALIVQTLSKGLESFATDSRTKLSGEIRPAIPRSPLQRSDQLRCEKAIGEFV